MLLDTHILMWLVSNDARLPQTLAAQLQALENDLVLSAVVAWEMSIKFHQGKLPSAAPLLADFPAVAARLGAEVLDITPAHAIRAGALDWTHRDPFDRMLVAQALGEGLRLVTLDESITSYAQAPILR
nr:type II toxin-antitoxin system VapC family toxin [Deinococcus aestuarii]